MVNQNLFLPIFVSKSTTLALFPGITFVFISAAIFLLMIYAAIVSFRENEKRAASRFILLGIMLPLPFLALAYSGFSAQMALSLILSLAIVTLSVMLLFPYGNKKNYRHAIPATRIDERDTMFSRNELKPGTTAFEKYYQDKPDKKKADDNFRSKAGLLKEGSSQFNPFQFASADASFETIGTLKNKVDGNVNDIQTKAAPEEISTYIKAWAAKLGALDCGITELKDYHLYSVGGRAERRDKKITRKHTYALAFTVEMDKEMVDAAPSGSIVMESAQQYLESGKIALQVASFIRNLGYEARAHIDGNYEVVCPLVARDAGLGEIGRMGLLMTPKLGPRVRISVVTTNMEFTTDKALHDYSMIDFCEKCKKCAEACPSKAISYGKRTEIDGVERWQINQEACFTLWCQLGTDCGRCVSVCPYAHPNNLLHNLVRKGLKQSSQFRWAAVKMDDFFYGKKPASAQIPKWMDITPEVNEE